MAAPVVAPSVDLGQALLSVVAEKTGYPLEMLGMGMALETDLGVDSIKRVEILSALTERASHRVLIFRTFLSKMLIF